MTDPSDIELIENYLQGRLSADEISQVMKRIEEDDEFAREVQFIRGLKQGIKVKGRENLGKQLKIIAKNYHKNQKTEGISEEYQSVSNRTDFRIVNFRTILSIAAAITFLIVFGVFYFKKEPSNIVADKDKSARLEFSKLTEGQILQVIHKPLIQYEDENGFGYADRDTTISTLPVITIPNDSIYKFYFSDTLYLFGSFGTDMEIIQRLDSPNSLLIVDGSKSFEIDVNTKRKLRQLKELSEGH